MSPTHTTQELARAKEERQALLANTKEQRAAERAAATKARKAAAAAAAAEAAQRFTLQPQKGGRHGSLQLPDTCLTNVMACLASTLEPGGLRGPSCVAKELAQASLVAAAAAAAAAAVPVCWDFYHAAKHGFTALAEAASSLQQLPPPDDLPDYVLQDLLEDLPQHRQHGQLPLLPFLQEDDLPQELQHELRPARRQNPRSSLKVTGTKAELVLRVLGAFGLTAPAKAPAALLRAMRLERSRLYAAWDGPDAEELQYSMLCFSECKKLAWLWDPVEGEPTGVAGVRAALCKTGYASMEEFKAVAQATQEAERQRRLEEQARRRAAAEAAAAARRARTDQLAQRPWPYQQQQPGQAQHVGLIRACGNKAAAACMRRCCGFCCKGKGGCLRHKL
ncbi:hypothetical protein OEZ85_002978 [Tetradesmus obliquus]|uniref:SAP domain-containing protein n=1 Tax=Tetradesmus obliquus TaxID=3088 RepID=A0ABY8U1G1_TETOB|nr:hypothetical protein OEZ85_002978 [Tetradesmus obliquus]